MVGRVAALSFLMFNLFSPPCFAALGAMNAEMQSKKWLWGGIALQLGTCLQPPVGKSGVNHRLRKIAEIAGKLKGEL